MNSHLQVEMEVFAHLAIKEIAKKINSEKDYDEVCINSQYVSFDCETVFQ